MYSFTGVNYLLCDTKFNPGYKMCLLKHTGDISYSGSFPHMAPLEYISGRSVCILITNCVGVKQ